MTGSQERTPMLIRARTLVVLLAMTAFPEVALGGEPAPVLAVFPVENRGTSLSATELAALGDYLGTRLGEGGSFHIIPSDDILKRLKEQKKETYRTCYDQNCQIEIGKELAAQMTVSLGISRLGSRCILTAGLYDIGRSATVNTATARARSCLADDLLLAIETVVTKLQSTRASSAHPVPPPIEAGSISPPVPEDPGAAVSLVRKKRTKSVAVAVILSFAPGVGMLYLEKYAWGAAYMTGSVGAIIAGMVVAVTESNVEYFAIGFGGGMLITLVGMVHTIIAAASWEDPDFEKPQMSRSGLNPPPGREIHPALIFPVFFTKF